MKKVRFNLQSNKLKEARIYLVFRWPGNRLLYNTPFTISPAHWDKTTQRVKPKNSVAAYTNPILDKLAATVLEHYYQCLYTDQPITIEGIKKKLNKVTHKKEKRAVAANKIGPVDFFAEWMQQRQLDPKYSESTISSYDSTLKQLKKYEKENEPLTWSHITEDFAADFAIFIQEKQGLNRNTANKYLSNLKTCLVSARAKGYTPGIIEYSVGTTEVDNVYLTLDELKQIENLLVNSEAESVARDRFLLGCYTGLRVSDYGQIQEHHFIQRAGVDFIEYNTKKSGKEIKVIIPVHPTVKRVFERLNDAPITTAQRWDVSNYIKDLVRRAGIVEPVTLIKNQKGKNVEVSGPKWQFVNTHTARRTFITNALISGVSHADIMAVTGIKKIQTLLKYNKLEKEKSALALAKSDFFKE